MYGLVVPGLCKIRFSVLFNEKNIIEDGEKNIGLTLFAKLTQFIANTGRRGFPPIASNHSNPFFPRWLYLANITFAFSMVVLNALSINDRYFSDTLPLRFSSHAFFLPFCFLFMIYSSLSLVPTDLSGTEKDGIIAWVVPHQMQRILRIYILISK